VISSASTTKAMQPGALTIARVVHFASLVFFGVLPVLVVVLLFVSAVGDDAVAFDFRPFYRAAGAILGGDTPYPGPTDPLTAAAGPYVYPPLPALLVAPLRVLPIDLAGLLLMVVLLAAAFAIPYVLGVRDWRCYGVAMLWPPVLSAIQTGNMTLLLGLVAALVWRSRERTVPSAALVGITLAAKIFLWPLVVWLGATRRIGAAALALVTGGACLLASWAVLGFAGFTSYPDLLHRLEATVGLDSYTLYVVGLDAGLPSVVARSLWLAFGIAVLAAVVVVARRDDERAAFTLAIAASLALTPIVWLHYFALLLVIVSLMQPRLAVAWFLPLAMVLTPGSGHPTAFETAWTLAVSAATVALAIRGVDVGRWFRADDRAAPAAAGR
jgi:glycosyl transferase family 87